ncbi:type II toxin-antitoxin system VapC family toxin [Methylobacterium sp. NEAU 140]|uniref:type II toxin-antitoxin system VapC family toxin n=1 Tax=Methylobacterium sp. NEAU 140 TaxID=3064945 RepID=UPI0027340E94|nr:type II toxin-antitoxin system VapC family toxin [Methylobacterium sp. NEAU 140]MDP4022714.1 type II toxin-antitoxin system VapC family toxin [Methylobacterium sp. NEAU 140]
MPYLDTSVLVAALTAEVETARVQSWLARQEVGTLVISAWVATEFSAALSIKARMGHLGTGHRTAALAAFSRLSAESFVLLPVPESAFREASQFADRSELGLRAGDALHLAILAEAGLALATLDRKLAQTGAALGIPIAHL